MYHLPELKKNLKNRNAGHLLDIATGEGDFLAFLLNAFALYESVTGLDMNPTNLRIAEEKLSEAMVSLVHGNAEQLAFEDEYFDTVSVSNSLHHFPNPRKVLKEMTRVLAPGGLLLISELVCEDLTPAQAAHLSYHHLKADMDMAAGHFHRHTFTQDEVVHLMEDLPVVIDKVFLAFDKAPMLNSSERLWRFFRMLDERVGEFAGHERGKEFEERADAVKENITTHGFMRPPQVCVMGLKSGFGR
jgi:ubiquinone/menaquinone biosynthesis C-methylase UbiE